MCLEILCLFRHYVITGPEDTPYSGGYYHGKILFPPEYPSKPPRIFMLTPNGRFACHVPICLSISDYHPEEWTSVETVSCILQGILDFMVSIFSKCFTGLNFSSHRLGLIDRHLQ